ncbi:AMP-binding protein, partial [Acinetobacter baumannii]
MIYPGEAYDARMTLEAVRDERCTALYGVPTMLITILNHPDLDQFVVSSLRTGIMAGAPCPAAMMEQIMDRLNMREVTIGYG